MTRTERSQGATPATVFTLSVAFAALGLVSCCILAVSCRSGITRSTDDSDLRLRRVRFCAYNVRKLERHFPVRSKGAIVRDELTSISQQSAKPKGRRARARTHSVELLCHLCLRKALLIVSNQCLTVHHPSGTLQVVHRFSLHPRYKVLSSRLHGVPGTRY
jgi:hypothetical protein